MDARPIAEMDHGAGWWCRDRTEQECVVDDKIDEPVSVWLDRALACVGADGAVDWAALAGVGFAHDLVLARRLVASHSHRDGGLVVCNVSAEHDGRAPERFDVEVHRGTFLSPRQSTQRRPRHARGAGSRPISRLFAAATMLWQDWWPWRRRGCRRRCTRAAQI